MAQANTFTTPKGIAQYPHLSKPDTKFSEPGDYKVHLILSAEEAVPIIEQINAAFADNMQAELKKQGKKELKAANPPYMEELGDDGQPTGNVIFKFKSTAAYKPAIFDAKGKPMTELTTLQLSVLELRYGSEQFRLLDLLKVVLMAQHALVLKRQ